MLYVSKLGIYLSFMVNIIRFKMNRINFQGGLRVAGKVGLRINGDVIIGHNFRCTSGNMSNPMASNVRGFIAVEKGAKLVIGDYVGMSSPILRCKTQISIGNNVTVGARVLITDFDAHSLNPAERIGHTAKGALSKPIIIHDHVFIGTQAMILKGVEIGENSVIGAGSVVTKSIPANQIWAGNPAKFIKNLPEF